MIERIVEITDHELYLSLYRGFMLVKKDGVEVGRVPLADMSVLLWSSLGSSISSRLVSALLDHNIIVVFCGENFHPKGFLWPMEGHHEHAGRVELQSSVSLPLKKRLWQQIVAAKIMAQSETLKRFDRSDEGLSALAKKVVSGDKDNLESQAARRYWPALMGPTFHRDRKAGGINAMLNYGYAVLRASTARAVSACGLHPAFGIHHRNDLNPFRLVDDLMEPFRPTVDCQVRKLFDAGQNEVDTHVKEKLVEILKMDFQSTRGITPLFNVLLWTAQSLVSSFRSKSARLELPLSVLPVAWTKKHE